MSSYDATAAARWIADQHATRQRYSNLPEAHRPPTIADAYAAQEALHRLLEPRLGPIAGLKIATTTKVMQQLMGIDHPCGGGILERTIHTSPAEIARADHQNVVLECELAVRLAVDLPAGRTPWYRDGVRPAIAAVMAAFELIEDRHASYRETQPTSLIADNAWNAGIVLGPPAMPSTGDLDGVAGRLTINGAEVRTGMTDDPLGALAWVANLACERGRPLRAGQVVITGSVVPTLPTRSGDRFHFTLDGIGDVELVTR